MSTQEAETDKTAGRVPKRGDWDRHKAQVAAANRARYRAWRDLSLAHREEFLALYESYAAAEGVTPLGPRERAEDGDGDGTAA